MPRSPNTPCSGCGKLCWPTYGKKGREAHRCRDCGPTQDGPGRRHGFSATYRAGCRCAECRAVNTARLAASNAARRAKVRGAAVEKFDPREVFERDGWVCGICQDPVDTSAKFPHPLSVSLDHIVPLSHGGSHSRDNTRCAHYSCNSRRGNRVDVA